MRCQSKRKNITHIEDGRDNMEIENDGSVGSFDEGLFLAYLLEELEKDEMSTRKRRVHIIGVNLRMSLDRLVVGSVKNEGNRESNDPNKTETYLDQDEGNLDLEKSTEKPVSLQAEELNKVSSQKSVSMTTIVKQRSYLTLTYTNY